MNPLDPNTRYRLQEVVNGSWQDIVASGDYERLETMLTLLVYLEKQGEYRILDTWIWED